MGEYGVIEWWVLLPPTVVVAALLALHARRTRPRQKAPAEPPQFTVGDPGYHRVLVAPFALAVLAYPAITVIAPNLAEPLLVFSVPVFAALVLIQVRKMLWPAVWLLALAAVYGVTLFGSTERFTPSPQQGFVHLVALICVGSTFLIFAIYGAAILSYRWMRFGFGLVVAADILVIMREVNQANASGGAVIYLLAVACVVYLSRSPSQSWWVAAVFCTAGVIIALTLEFRALIVYVAFFAPAYLCAHVMSRRVYRWTGIVASTAVVLAVVWFYLNIRTSDLAASLADEVEQLSGSRANSGREFLWPRLLDATTAENPAFGLGAGALPRDILNTELSTHNYFIQAYLQVGIVGLTALILFLLSVWFMLSKTTTAAGRFGSAVFLMFVVHNGTEVLMFQNLTIIAIPAWCAIGLAIAVDRYTQPPGGVGTDNGDAIRADRSDSPHSMLA